MKNHSIPVCNSHSNSAAVAEFALSLTLGLTKKLSYHDNKMRRSDWNRSEEKVSLKSEMIKGSNICILGYGNIGRKIGILLNAFRANIYAVMNCRRDYPEVRKSFSREEWAEGVKKSDIIICTLPLTNLTRNMINKSTIDFFKQGSKLINVSRAEVVDEEVLFDALASGRLSGYASDVWWKKPSRGESESKISNKHRFDKLENVLLSPHRAGFIADMLPHLDDGIDNIANIFLDRPLKNVLDVRKQY